MGDGPWCMDGWSWVPGGVMIDGGGVWMVVYGLGGGVWMWMWMVQCIGVKGDGTVMHCRTWCIGGKWCNGKGHCSYNHFCIMELL
jgi:hypothetical protein